MSYTYKLAINQSLDAIDLCLKNKLFLPALGIIYSSIDSLAYIAYDDNAVRTRFTKWVDNFLYKNRTLDPTSLDLYVARCAILHRLTPDSDLSKNGAARKINYSWGTADPSLIVDVCPDHSYLHIEEFNELFKEAIAIFNNDLENNDLESSNVEEKLNCFYEHVPKLK